MGASPEAAGGAVSCHCHSAAPRILSDSQALPPPQLPARKYTASRQSAAELPGRRY